MGIKFFTLSAVLVQILVAETFKPPTIIIETGIQGKHMDYEEVDELGDILDTEKSKIDELKGYFISLKYKVADGTIMGNSNYLEIKASTLNGNTDYTGAYIGSGLGYGSLKSKTSNDIDEVEVNFYETEYAQDHIGFIFAGLGYRKWDRQLSGTQLEKYRWLNFNIGMGGETEIVPNYMRIGLDAAIKMSLWKEMKIETPTFNETFKLGTVTTMVVGVPLVTHLNEYFDFIIRVEYEYMKIEKSNVIEGYYEPESESHNFNAMASIRAQF